MQALTVCSRIMEGQPWPHLQVSKTEHSTALASKASFILPPFFAFYSFSLSSSPPLPQTSSLFIAKASLELPSSYVGFPSAGIAGRTTVLDLWGRMSNSSLRGIQIVQPIYFNFHNRGRIASPIDYYCCGTPGWPGILFTYEEDTSVFPCIFLLSYRPTQHIWRQKAHQPIANQKPPDSS